MKIKINNLLNVCVCQYLPHNQSAGNLELVEAAAALPSSSDNVIIAFYCAELILFLNSSRTTLPNTELLMYKHYNHKCDRETHTRGSQQRVLI